MVSSQKNPNIVLWLQIRRAKAKPILLRDEKNLVREHSVLPPWTPSPALIRDGLMILTELSLDEAVILVHDVVFTRVVLESVFKSMSPKGPLRVPKVH